MASMLGTAFAQAAPTVLINNGDQTTKSKVVTIQLQCGSFCRDIQISWANADANTNSGIADMITVTASSPSGGSDQFTAVETGPDTGFFVMRISNAPVILIQSIGPIILPDAITWRDGETVTIQNLPFSSQLGTKSLDAVFSAPTGASIRASDNIELISDVGNCSESSEKVAFSTSSSLLMSTKDIAPSTTLILSAPKSNIGNVWMNIGISEPTGGPHPSLSQNDALISPGETKNIKLSLDTSDNISFGNYTYRASVWGRDMFQCNIKETSADIELRIFPEPDFIFSSSLPALIIPRGNSSSLQTTIQTVGDTFGPLHIEFQEGWDPVKPEPTDTEIRFDSSANNLEPGESLSRKVEISPKITDDPSVADYAGEFTYFVRAIGTWVDATGTSRTIVKELKLPISISEKDFDFSISADQESLFLEKDKMATVSLFLKHLSGRAYPVTLKVVVAPLGIDTELEQKSGVPDFSTKLNIRARAELSSREMEVVAEGGGKTHSVKVTLSSRPFMIVLSPESIVSPGQASKLIVSIDKMVQNYNSTVYLRFSSEIPQSKLTLGKGEAVPPYTSELVIMTGSGTPLGDYPIRLTASDGVTSESVVHTIHVALQSIHIDMEPRLDSLTIDGLPISSKDLYASPNWKFGERHVLTALAEVPVNATTRFVFDTWSDGMKSPDRVVNVSTQGLTVVGKYRPQYMLNIESVNGNTIGAGWYDASTMADFGIAKDAVSLFNRWSGESADVVNITCDGQKIKHDTGSSSGSFKICMDKPQTLVALWKGGESSTGLTTPTTVIAGILATAAIGGFVAMAHFVLPKPLSKPTIPVDRGHTFGFRVEVHLDEVSGIIGSSDAQGGMLASIPSLSVDSLSQTANNAFNMLLLQDTGETFEQFKQLKFVKNWIKKSRPAQDPSSVAATLSAGGGSASSGLDVVNELKKIIAENLGKASTPELVRMIRGALVSQVHSQLEKGLETVPVPLPVIGISIEFIPLIDSVPVKNNILKIPFQIAPTIELKGAKSVLRGGSKSFFADFIDLRMKLYYMMPMMIGLKKVRMAENLSHIAKDVSFQRNSE